MQLNKILCGDVLTEMKKIENGFVDCIITSPPYWQLRDYGWDGQWGLEPTYQEYLDHMLLFMSECKRVLKDTGTMWINLGDTYARGSRNKKASNNQSLRSKHEFDIEPETKPNYQGLNKCLTLIPHRFAIRCIDELGLILRNDIIWAKRNGMPESVTDRFSKKHEFIFFFTKQEKYYFDLDSVKCLTVTKDKSIRNQSTTKLNNTPGRTKMNGLKTNNYDKKNPGDVSDFWDITTKPNKAKHYASFNSELIDKPIIAGCPPDGIILDPFCGTGTTLIRGYELHRNVIGIEGKKEYVEMAQTRLNEAVSQTRFAI